MEKAPDASIDANFIETALFGNELSKRVCSAIS